MPRPTTRNEPADVRSMPGPPAPSECANSSSPTRVQTARRATCNLYAPNNFASPLGDVNGDGDGYVCLSRTRHLSAGEKAFESHYDPFPLYPYRSRGNKKCKRQIATGTEACPGSHRF